MDKLGWVFHEPQQSRALIELVQLIYNQELKEYVNDLSNIFSTSIGCFLEPQAFKRFFKLFLCLN